jgi:lysophospholipase L1-like esterase
MNAIVARMRETESYRIFVVGDSLTEGIRIEDPEDVYVAAFARGLAERMTDRRVVRYDGRRQDHPDAELMSVASYGDVITVQKGTAGEITVVRSGIGGNTVRRMLNRQQDFLGETFLGSSADLLIVEVGVNDALACDPAKYVTAEVFGQDLHELLDLIEREDPETDVIFMTPTYNDVGGRPTSCVDAYDAEMQRVARERCVPVVDLHRLWMAHLEIGSYNYGQREWLTGILGDTCHPSPEGHRAIAREMLRTLFEE